ncbi:hypothetical protein P175DRAFT_0238533 [Aspergillus ochraceoroseus IBT 24754]|uniref:DNA endonuclease activator Ctp1 C-terminal domain-containing protein n=2 Tax=Aspergillus ochraceoroseus TaxID=138278 RepID=A0A2T5LXB5_9EURO|nr:uncharacterized protein P175DRAFT_0238533 [Aspergillus ochraceoroseus IBT 24754]KKK13615.1 hypothetical protein AOCH_003515 [Aspergillus ochraceoroseus]PTU20935.1 hypothetical protein P175DRAFT_0238533 [Aspergillus ochraceoroseus IBT 24754]
MEVLKQLHTSVAQAFENSFDKAYRDFNAELNRCNARVRDAEQKAEEAEEAHHNTTSEITILRDKIALLQEELRQNEIDSKERELTAETSLQLEEMYDPSHVLGDISTSDLSAADMNAVCNKYAKLYEQASILVRASGDLRRQVKRHKRKLEHFQKSLQRQDFSLLINGTIVRFQRVKSTEPSDQEDLPVPRSTSMATGLLDIPNSKAQANDSTPASTVPISGANSDPVGAGAAGESENGRENRFQGKYPESNSTPSDVSTDEVQPSIATVDSRTQNSRMLKRKRPEFGRSLSGNNSSLRGPENGGSERPIVVKSETLSSSPLRMYSQHAAPSTQDLDDIGSSVATPTKETPFYRDQDILPQQRDPAASIGSPSTRRMQPNHTNVQNQSILRWPGILQPINDNPRNISSPVQPHKGRVKMFNKEFKSRISSIAEDGDENYCQSSTRGQENRSPEKRPKTHPSTSQRLQDLLEKPSPTSRLLLQLNGHEAHTPIQSCTRHSPTKDRTSIRCQKRTDTTMPSNAATISGSSRPSSSSGIRQNESRPSRQTRGPSQIDVLPDDEPFRARPLRRLDLEHFKINPDYNHGLDYAYNEVVRKRDERKCINGCTRPGCCGDKFLAMARFGFPTNPSTKDKDDLEILEEYLGGDKHLIDKLSPEERRSLLEEAKARDISNRFGRHRHQHQRPSTPPGFWRTDMPGTQELEDDHEEAQRMQRDEVKRRHREAMRAGGQWKFADE